MPQRPQPHPSTATPSQDAWGLALQILPAHLADLSAKFDEYGQTRRFGDHRDWQPDRQRQEGRDVLALVLAKKPGTPEAYRAHSEASKFLLRRALAASQHIGRTLLELRRESEARCYVNVSDAAFAVGLQRPREHLSPERRVCYPEVFWAVPALRETDEEAQGQTRRARAYAEGERNRAEADEYYRLW